MSTVIPNVKKQQNALAYSVVETVLGNPLVVK